MAASNQFGTNKQMNPINEPQSNDPDKPLTQRFSRSHKITTRRHPEPEPAHNNAVVLPSTSKPPFSNLFQHYQQAGMHLPSYSSSLLSNRTETSAQNARPAWPSVWDPSLKFPLLEQHLHQNNKLPATPNWNNSVQNHERMQPNYIHEQNTVQYSQSGGLSFQHSLRQNYMMATQTLRTFVNRSQEANNSGADKTPMIEYRESRFSMPPLQPIAGLRSEDLKRMAEMSKLMNGQPNAIEAARNGNEAQTSELEKHLSSPTTKKEKKKDEVVSSDSDDLVIVEKPSVKCESPITISSDESEGDKMETSLTVSCEAILEDSLEPPTRLEDSLSDHLEPPTRFSPNGTIEQSETVSSLDTSDEAKNEVVSSNDTESQVDGESSDALITLRFCTVRLNVNDIRELVKTPANEDVFVVRQLKDSVFDEKPITPCFKRKSKAASDELVNGSAETANPGAKRKPSFAGEYAKPRKFPNNFSQPSLLAKRSTRRYMDVVICGKCKCRVADADEHAAPTCCDLTDIYPCLDAKCEKTFICFKRYQAHVEAHGYKVCQPKTNSQPDDEDDDEGDEATERDAPEMPTNCREKCVFCADMFAHYDDLSLHLEQIHRVKSDSEFLEHSNAKSLFAGVKEWLGELDDGAPETCKLCFEERSLSEMRNHLVDYHSVEKGTNLVRIVSLKPKKKRLDVSKFIVPASEVEETPSPTSGVIVRKIKMTEPDTTREKAPPSLKDVEKWLRGLEDGVDGAGIVCLFCEKMFLSAFAVYKHLKTSHWTCVGKIFGGNLLAELEDVEKSYSVKAGLAFCSEMCEMDRVVEKVKVLLMHFVDADTRKAFDFDSSPVGEILVKLLYEMKCSYCLFDENSEKDVAFDALGRNVRTFLLACVAPEVRNLVGFDTSSVEQVLDNLFEFIGVV